MNGNEMSMNMEIIRYVDEETINEQIAEFVKKGKLPRCLDGNLTFSIKGDMIINPESKTLMLKITTFY